MVKQVRLNATLSPGFCFTLFVSMDYNNNNNNNNNNNSNNK